MEKLNNIIAVTTLSLLIFHNLSLADDKPPLTVKAGIDRDSVSIGDKIKYTLAVSTKQNIEVEFPSFAENLGGFAIKDFSSSKKEFFGKKKIIQWYILDTYTTGKYTIPKVVIKYREKDKKDWNEIETAEIQIEVKSILDDAKEHSDIRDVKKTVNFPANLIPYIIAGALIFVLLSLALSISLIRKRKAEEVFFARPPHEIAYERLEELKKKDFAKQGRIKEYYIELSDIVRCYMEGRFSMRAPEMTTEEFLLKVRDYNELSAEHKGLLRDFLLHCDLVKFAKYNASEKEIDSSFESAKRFVDQTRIVNSK